MARFFCIDPIASDVPALSPYQYASNNPVWCTDLEGMEGVPAQLMGNGMWSTAQSSTYQTPMVVKEIAHQNISQNNGVAGISSASGTISEHHPNTIGQVRELVNNIPGTSIGGKAIKFLLNADLNIINDAHTLATGFVNGPEHAYDAEGHGKNRAEYTEAGMNTIINLAPTPDLIKVPGVKLNAAEFSSLNKGAEVLTKAKSEVGTIIKQTNNATVEASQAIKKSTQAINTVSTVGNIKQQIDLKKKENE